MTSELKGRLKALMEKQDELLAHKEVTDKLVNDALHAMQKYDSMYTKYSEESDAFLDAVRKEIVTDLQAKMDELGLEGSIDILTGDGAEEAAKKAEAEGKMVINVAEVSAKSFLETMIARGILDTKGDA